MYCFRLFPTNAKESERNLVFPDVKNCVSPILLSSSNDCVLLLALVAY